MFLYLFRRQCDGLVHLNSPGIIHPEFTFFVFPIGQWWVPRPAELATQLWESSTGLIGHTFLEAFWFHILIAYEREITMTPLC